MTQYEQSKDRFLDRISDVDRTNLETLVTVFQSVSQERNLAVSLVGFGSALAKDGPVSNIDIMTVFEDSEQLPQQDKYKSTRNYVITDFEILVNLASVAMDKANAEIVKVSMPIDNRAGSIYIQFPAGVPIKLTQYSQREINDFIATQKEPYAILSQPV